MRRGGGGPVPSTAPLRLRSALLRTVRALDHELVRASDPSGLTATTVHDLHRDLRRLASGLTVWGQLISRLREEEVEVLARRVRRLARLVGRVRDRDVTGELLAPGPRETGLSVAWWAFLGRLREDAHTGRELLRAFLTREQQAGLFDRAVRLLDLPPRADAARGLARILAEERRLRQGRVRRAHRKASRKPSSERLHRLRIRIRQWRHLATLELATRAASHHPPPASWARLQRRLGELHDLDVTLASVPRELGESATPVHLRARRRLLRRTLEGDLERIVLRRGRAPLAPGRGRVR